MTAIKTSSTNQINKRVIVTKCPVTFTLHMIGGRWKPLIINCLLTGTKRYGEIRKAIPAISEKMLIQNLKELEADDLLIRNAKPVVPPHVEYRLSECGEELRPVLLSMKKWALKHNI
ncbi:winged helix-turn-helix transcriptional regulator [Arachidicoccus soli]|uniref:Transcriptional regulator n=1 Tax=Arachidicoccus soli TaxID=2341117 RepID=A0A386HN74_9BACT|nr:helix-turn-helix domain-containing protein [Arachidicoccus soli]AYD47357.1 transcriptional regulator [Arachidicoccus soli]